jgi:tyrosine-protein kinase Etk/Wzc
MIHTETIDQSRDRSSQGVQSDFSALDFLVVLARHKRFILRFTLGTAALMVIVSLLIPNWYTAATIVLPPNQSSSMSSALLSQLGGSSGAGALATLAGGSLGIKNTGEMYVSLFHSRGVEDAVIQRFGLQARYRKKTMYDTRRTFERHSTVVLGMKDGLIRIEVEDRDPKRAAEIANGYVEEFRKLSANLAITEASQRRLFFQQQLLDAMGNLTTAEEAMKRTQHSTGVLQIDSQAKSLIEAAGVLRGQVVAKEVQLQAMRAYATEDNPQVVMVKDQLAALKAQLSKLASAEQESASEFIVPKGRVPEAGMEYLRKLRDMKYHETVYELIAKQLELAKLDEAREGPLIQVADVAVTPDKKSFPHRTIIVILVTLLGFLAACGWSAISERIQRMEQNSADRKRLDALRAALFRRLDRI